MRIGYIMEMLIIGTLLGFCFAVAVYGIYQLVYNVSDFYCK